MKAAAALGLTVSALAVSTAKAAEAINMAMPSIRDVAERLKALDEGGKGSGNWGHASVKGERGGSKAGTGGLDKKFLKGSGKVGPEGVAGTCSKIYSNWRQEKAEKMVLIAKDGEYFVVGSDERGAVSISMRQIDQMLKERGKTFSDVATIIHNHNEGEAPSKGDVLALQAFMAAGFGGESKTYTPKSGRLQDVPYSLPGGK